MDVVRLTDSAEAEPTPARPDWGSLIWPGGRPSGETAIQADRDAAAAAVAARAASELPEDLVPADLLGRSSVPSQRSNPLDLSDFSAAVRNRPAMVRIADAPPAEVESAGVAAGVESAAESGVAAGFEALREASDENESAGVRGDRAGRAGRATRGSNRSGASTRLSDLEPWNPEATYESLVRLLAELQALHPSDVAVLPTGPRRRLPRPRPRLLAAIAAGAVLVAGIGWVATSSHHAVKPKAAVVAPHTSTALIALEDAGEIKGAVLLANNGKTSQEVLIPSRLLVDIPGLGSAELATAPQSGVNAASDAIENALHTRVDGTWVLSSTQLSTLVDALGGVNVTLTDDVLPQDGTTSVGVGAGTTKVGGALAAQLAFTIGSQEPEASRLARQQILLEAIISALPADPAKVAALLQSTSLSGGLTANALAAELVAVRTDLGEDQAASTVVPTNEIDSGSSEPAYGLDEKAADTMVDQRLSGAELPMPASGRSRVLVQNGIGTPGLGDAARAVLVSHGYAFRGGGNVQKFGTGTSVVLIPDATAPNRALGSTIATLLGLPQTAVELDPDQTTIADVVVILGSDFTPKAPTTP